MYLPKTNNNKNTDQGLVVQKPVNANPGLKVNRAIYSSCLQMFFIALVKCSLGLAKLKLKLENKHNQKTLPKSYKTEMKIRSNPELASSGF